MPYWSALAASIGLAPDAFGDTLATDGMLYLAKKAQAARDDLAKLDRAIRALKSCTLAIDGIVDQLKLQRAACRHRIEASPTSHGKRADAYWLAEKIARTFADHGKPVTFGASPIDDGPSTPYCRAVRDGFVLLKVGGGWKGPARAAWLQYRD